MPNWQAGLGGAASGAGEGAAIGSLIPGIGTGIGAGVGALAGGVLGLFGGGNDDALQANVKMYQEALAAYQRDPSNKEALDTLQALTTQGLTAQEKSELQQAALDAGNVSRSREGAVDLQAAQRSGGVSSSGMTGGLKDLAAQGAAQTYGVQAEQAAGQADQRRMAAISAMNSERARQQQMTAYYQSQVAGANSGVQDYGERNSEAMLQNIAGGANMAAGAAAYNKYLDRLPGTTTPGGPPVSAPGYWPQLPNSPSGPKAPSPYAGFAASLYGGNQGGAWAGGQ